MDATPAAVLPDPVTADLTPEQRAAVSFSGGPILVLAGAGSGKTRVVTRRIARLVAGGVPPHRILAITFTNKAADEMRRRVAALVQRGGEEGAIGGGVWVSTFHALGARWLRRLAERRPVEGRDAHFAIYDRDDAKRVVREVAAEIGLSPTGFPPGPIIERIARWKDSFTSPAGAASRALGERDRTIARIYEKYEGRLARQNAFDFEDLIARLVETLETDGAALEEITRRFQHVLVDEYQDTNPSQHRLVLLLAGPARNICVVGDPDQSIYGWRGADIGNILRFEEDFPEARVFRIEQNWRSTKCILRAAQGVIRNNRARKEKGLYTENEDGRPVAIRLLKDEIEEARWVAARVREGLREGTPASEIAVFFRTNAMSRAIEQVFLEEEIPYRLVGTIAFYQRSEVKDVLAYARLLSNPRDDLSFLRVVNLPPRGIGDRTVDLLKGFAASADVPLLAAAHRAEEIPETGARARKALAEFTGLWADFRREAGGSPAGTLRSIVRRSGIEKALAAEGVAGEERLENVWQLVRAAEEMEERGEARDLDAFLERVALVSDDEAREDGSDPRVALMTIHSAKGLEFERVFVIGLEEGLLPHAWAESEPDIEEERRLCYVAMTRAKRYLTLTAARFRAQYGGDRGASVETPRTVSRFLAEIPEEAIDRASGGATSYPVPGPFRPPAAATVEERSPGAGPRDLAPGDRVVHASFGVGTVLALSGAGLGRKVEVRFDGAGRKLLVLHYANLRRDGGGA